MCRTSGPQPALQSLADAAQAAGGRQGDLDRGAVGDGDRAVAGGTGRKPRGVMSVGAATGGREAVAVRGRRPPAGQLQRRARGCGLGPADHGGGGACGRKVDRARRRGARAGRGSRGGRGCLARRPGARGAHGQRRGGGRRRSVRARGGRTPCRARHARARARARGQGRAGEVGLGRRRQQLDLGELAGRSYGAPRQRGSRERQQQRAVHQGRQQQRTSEPASAHAYVVTRAREDARATAEPPGRSVDLEQSTASAGRSRSAARSSPRASHPWPGPGRPWRSRRR